MIYFMRLFIFLFLTVCGVQAASPDAVLASIPQDVKTIFTDAAQQFVQLKAQKSSAQELYKPYAQATGQIIPMLVTHHNAQERNELLQHLINALKLSFWYPEIWISGSKKIDKRYEALFSKPSLQDGSDTLVGEVFAQHEFTIQGMVEAAHSLIIYTLYTIRSNAALQGAIITGLGVFLKTYFETREIVIDLFNTLKAATLGQYAALMATIITQEIPKYSPLVRGLLINLSIEFLLKSPIIGATDSGQNVDAKEIDMIKQKFSNLSTRQEYAATVRTIITQLDKYNSGMRHKILQEICSLLLASPVIIVPERRVQTTASDQLAPSRNCIWYEVHCWILKGFEELERTLIHEAKKRPIKSCPNSTPEQPTRGPKTEFSVLTFNTYCFPKGTTSTLRAAKEVAGAFDKGAAGNLPDLQSGIYKSVNTRIAEIAKFAMGVGTLVVCYQELWSDGNKEKMVENVCPYYPYNYYVNAEVFGYSLAMMDDGLMISSHLPFVFTQSIVFKDRIEDEKLAHKGALFAGVYDLEGNPIIIVNTHLQSGRSLDAIAVKQKQMHEIGQKLQEIIAEYPAFKEGRICVAGDLNEAIQFKADRKLLADRTKYLVQALNDTGIKVSNDQIVQRLAVNLGAQEIVEIDELDKQGIVKTPAGKVKGFIGIDDPLVQRAGTYGFDPIMYASDPDGTQLLDHVFVDNKSKITGFDVFRYEVLGGVGRLQGSDLPKSAISDHAAVKVTFERVK